MECLPSFIKENFEEQQKGRSKSLILVGYKDHEKDYYLKPENSQSKH